MRRFCVVAIAVVFTACTPQETRYDVLVINGLVYDGTEVDPEQRNIAISDGRIVSTDAAADASASRVIDAAGMLVMPGFIDPHTHAPLNADNIDGTSHINYLTQGITTVVVGNDGDGVVNRKSKFEQLAASGFGANVAFYAGHGEIRERVMDYADRAPNDDEMSLMQELLVAEMEAGALGLSTGLYYAPGSFAATDEVIALARTAAKYGGIYDTHLRDESTYNIGLIAAVEEAIRIGEETGIPVHISHIKALGREVWGKSDEVIAIVNAARENGIDVTANQYPWEASAVDLSSALVPRWVMAGSKAERRARLEDASLLPRIRSEMQRNLERRGGPTAILIVDVTSQQRGKTLDEVAVDLDTDAIDAAIALVLDDDPKIASFVMHVDDINAFRVQPWLMTGSDGGSGHPRFFASYPKAWRDFVVDRKLLTDKQFVHRSTGLVADTLGLCDRGYLRPDYVADLIVVDPDNFLPHATYEMPEELSTGIQYMLINGEIVIDNGQQPEQRAGLLLRRNRANCTNANADSNS